MRLARQVAILGALAALGAAGHAHAQACCSGGSALSPARLMTHEDFLLGARAKGFDALARFDSKGNVRRKVHDREGEFDLLAAVRLSRRLQLSLTVPWLIIQRRSGDLHATGTGLGDVSIQGRFELVRARELRGIPGVSLVAGVRLPSGRAPEDAREDLAVDATGTGRVHGTVGLALEHLVGPVFLQAILQHEVATSRTVNGARSTLAPRWIGSGAVGYVWPTDVAVALSYAQSYAGDATYAGEPIPDSGRSLGTASLSGMVPLSPSDRIQPLLWLDPPVSGLGKNELASFGISFAWMHTWS